MWICVFLTYRLNHRTETKAPASGHLRYYLLILRHEGIDCILNVMAHAQKPHFVFRWNGRVHLNRRGRQFFRLLAAKVCTSAVVMLDTPCSEVVWEYWLPTPFASFHFTSPPVRHRVPSHFNWTLQQYSYVADDIRTHYLSHLHVIDSSLLTATTGILKL